MNSSTLPPISKRKSKEKSKPHMPQTLTLDHVSPATRLLEKRRQMFEVQEALDAQKEEFARREDAFRRREEGLRKKDLELQESLIKFNKFLQENESKRNRAIKRASDEKRQREAKEVEIERLSKTLESYNAECSELNTKVNRHLKYFRYLETVQESVPEDYPEITDLVNRYNTLRDANIDLTQRQAAHESDNDERRTTFANYGKSQANDMLNFNNEIARLQKSLEVAQEDFVKAQNEVDIATRSSGDKTLELGQVFMAVGNLLGRCTSGIHGAILKHTENSNVIITTTTTDKKSESSSSNNNMMSDPALILSEQKAMDMKLMIENGEKAVSDLQVIAAYMLDFKSIVEDQKKKQTK